MNSKKLLRKTNLFLIISLIFLIIYSFDYSLGWGMNLMFPNIYLFTIGKGNSGYIGYLWNENGIIENFQIIILFLNLSLLFFIFFKNKNSSVLLKNFLILSIIGISYIFLEEISWGQHLLNFKSPEILTDKDSIIYNKQGEFNLHNISNLFNEIPRSLILIWCTLSIPILRIINYLRIDDINLIIEPNKKLINLSYFILFISLPDLLINKFDLIDNSKLFIFNENGFVKYDINQLLLSILSLNFIRFSELQEVLIYYYFLSHSLYLKNSKLINKNQIFK